MPATEDQPRLCVFCRKRPIEHAWRPFCSERCKLKDLARWADGSYRMPAEGTTAPEESENLEVKTQNDSNS